MDPPSRPGKVGSVDRAMPSGDTKTLPVTAEKKYIEGTTKTDANFNIWLKHKDLFAPTVFLQWGHCKGRGRRIISCDAVA